MSDYLIWNSPLLSYEAIARRRMADRTAGILPRRFLERREP